MWTLKWLHREQLLYVFVHDQADCAVAEGVQRFLPSLSTAISRDALEIWWDDAQQSAQNMNLVALVVAQVNVVSEPEPANWQFGPQLRSGWLVGLGAQLPIGGRAGWGRSQAARTAREARVHAHGKSSELVKVAPSPVDTVPVRVSSKPI